MRTLAAAAGVAAVLVAGPAWAGQHYMVVASNPKSGSTIEIPHGDKLLLKLTACESCGYSWRITQKPNAQVVTFDKRLQSVNQCTGQCTGGNATERFQFSSTNVGTTSLKLGYFGPGKARPSKTLQLKLVVVA